MPIKKPTKRAASLRTGKNALNATSAATIRRATTASAAARRGQSRFKEYNDGIPF